MDQPKRVRRQPPAAEAAKKSAVDKGVQAAVSQAGKKTAKKASKTSSKSTSKDPVLPKIKPPTKAVAADWGLNGATQQERVLGVQTKLSSMLSGMVSQAQTIYNDPSICAAEDSLKLLVTLPVPSLSLEYLLGNNGLPLGIMLQLVGEQASCKSGMVCEMGNWFMKAGGFVHLHEHESKYSPTWINSIIGWVPEGQPKKPFVIIPSHSVDMWQKRVTLGVEQVKKIMLGTSAEPGPGVMFPYLTAVDSILGKPLESTQKKIDDEGATGRRFATEAASMKDYLSTFASKLIEWPFVFVMVNHLKLQQEEGQQQKTRKKQGGSSKEFLETIELEMRKTKDIATTQYEGAELQIQIFKNSLARGNKRKIPVHVHWWDDPEDGKQRTKFLWNSSTIQLLLSPPEHYKSRIKEIIDLTKPAGLTKVWSKRLGISQKEPLDFEEAGAILHADADLMRSLRRVFGITESKVYQPAVDYRYQRSLVRAEIGEALRKEL